MFSRLNRRFKKHDSLPLNTVLRQYVNENIEASIKATWRIEPRKM
jgi:hypothetical protein